MERFSFPARVTIFSFKNFTIKVSFPTLYVDLTFKQLCVPPRETFT